MIKQLKIMPLFRIELTLSFLLFLTSLSSLAQSGLQSGTPNWLPDITGQAQQNQTTPLPVNAAQTSATLTFNAIPDQAHGTGPIDVSGYATTDSSNPIEFSITGGTSVGTTIIQDGTVLNLGGTGTVVVKARVEDGVDEQPLFDRLDARIKI